MYLETTDPERWPYEITLLKKIIAGDTDEALALHMTDFQIELLKKFQGGGAQSLFG
jgi:hypothetical protein